MVWRPTHQRLAEAEATAAKLKQTRRAEDTRKKVLVGALVLARAETDANLRQWLVKALLAGITRPNDRRLFSDFIGSEESK